MSRTANSTLQLIFLLIFVTGLFGCATFRGKNLERQALQNQVQVLQVQLEQKDAEISQLRETLNNEINERQKLIERLNKAKTGSGTVSKVTKPSVKQIQNALKNAGYNPGPIDGKMGKRTKEAIKAFQRANDLKVDGKVGKGTWRILKKYLYRKSK
jgi:murein L,D-transpeptidase YcbB/YkuD